jgi:hypothetical protein
MCRLQCLDIGFYQLPSSLASAGVRSSTATASKSAAAALAASAALEMGGSSNSTGRSFRGGATPLGGGGRTPLVFPSVGVA